MIWEQMSDIESVMAELQETYGPDRSYVGRPDHLVDADVERWRRMLHLSRSELYDRIGLYLARGRPCSGKFIWHSMRASIGTRTTNRRQIRSRRILIRWWQR